MSEYADLEIDGEYQRVELTEDVRDVLDKQGIELPKGEKQLVKRVEELLYNIVEVKPRDAISRTEVVVTDTNDGASLDHGQPQMLDEADDVQITMIRPDEITVGWSDEE